VTWDQNRADIGSDDTRPPTRRQKIVTKKQSKIKAAPGPEP